jgi:hypothetical protein
MMRAVNREASSRRDRRIREHLDLGEPLYASAVFNAGSITRAALLRGSAPIVRLAVTDRRLVVFATSDLAFNLNLGDLLLSITYSEIQRVEYSTFRPVGISGLRLTLALADTRTFVLEASGFFAPGAKRLAPILEKAVVSSRHGY